MWTAAPGSYNQMRCYIKLVQIEVHATRSRCQTMLIQVEGPKLFCACAWCRGVCVCVCVPARACPRGYKQVYVGRQWMGMCAAPVQIAHPQLILLLLQLRSCAVQAATRVPCCCQLLRQAGDLRCRLLPACLCCPRCCCCFVLCLDGPLSSVLAGFGPLACIRPAAMISMPTATSRSG